MTSLLPTEDPFIDPATDVDDRTYDHAFAAESTLAVGRDGSLTLGTDSLIILGRDRLIDWSRQTALTRCKQMKPLRTRIAQIVVASGPPVRNPPRTNCVSSTDGYGTGSIPTRAIPFYNVLWAELQDTEITIQYAQSTSKTTVRAASVKYSLEKSDKQRCTEWISRLLDRAYGEAQRQKRAKVLVNPYSGKGSAEKWYTRDVEPILSAARCSIDTVKTAYRGEAVEIAEKLNISDYDMIVSCSGDGLPHEVFNGLGKRGDARKALQKIAVVHVPCGSGNAMSCNLNGTDSSSLATLAIIKGIPTPLDLVSITQGTTRTLSFLSQSVGIVAESDLGTEHLRWLGPARFTYGFLVRLLGKTVYPCDIAIKVAIDDKDAIREHYRREVGDYVAVTERRENNHLTDDDASSNTASGSEDGLPALRYGTVNDKLPEGWETVPYDKLGNFYCGNVGHDSAFSHISALTDHRWHTWPPTPFSFPQLYQMMAIWI